MAFSTQVYELLSFTESVLEQENRGVLNSETVVDIWSDIGESILEQMRIDIAKAADDGN